MYEDLFTKRGIAPLTRAFYAAKATIKSSTTDKSDGKSLEKRTEGNKQFGKGEWAGAMEKYNESLCFATSGSQNIRLAYANRSACFLNLKMYHQCLIDIRLAKEAGYPEHLMPKLNKREADARKHIEDGAQLDDFGLKLTLEPNEKFPFMADVLKFDTDNKGNLILAAKEDIDVCQTIAVEKAFTTCLYTRYGWACNICLKKNTNLIPCTKCTVAMFCDEECQKNFLHDGECGLKLSHNRQQNGMIMNEVRIILMAIDMFSNADELMKFVEQAINSKKNTTPQAMLDLQSKYREFLRLPIVKAHASLVNYDLTIYFIYKMVLDIPKVSEFFRSPKHLRFLMHLIGHHQQLSECNSMRVRSGIAFNSEKKIMCSHTGLLKKYLQHSCAPNVYWMDRDGHSVLTSIRPIKKGDSLLISVFDYMSLYEKKAERRTKLWEQKKIISKCTS